MAREQIRRMVEESKAAVQKEADEAAGAVRERIGSMKKETLERV